MNIIRKVGEMRRREKIERKRKVREARRKLKLKADAPVDAALIEATRSCATPPK